MQKKLILILLIVGATVSLYFTQKKGSRIDFSPYGIAGAVAAEETANLIGGKGEIALYTIDAEETIPALHEQVKSFKETLKAKDITIFAVEKIKIGGMSTEVAPDQIAKTLENHSGLKAIVSFVRLSPLSVADGAALKQNGTKLVVISSYYPMYKNLLNSGLLQLAVVPRLAGQENPQKPKTVRDQFDQMYQLLRPENPAVPP